jgi:hypothetical protein
MTAADEAGGNGGAGGCRERVAEGLRANLERNHDSRGEEVRTSQRTEEHELIK